MKSRTTRRFRKCLDALPGEVRRQARRAYEQFRRDPTDPSLRLKRVHPVEPIYSVRISLGYRALGVREADTIIWFWIGSHDDYDTLVS